MKHAIFLVFIVLASGAQAQEVAATRPYSFSGTCTSQGLWTREALQLTQQIRNFTLQMKDDPNCRALGAQMQTALTTLGTIVQPATEEKYSHRLTELPQEIAAFRQFLSEGKSSFHGPVLQTMMRKGVELATLSASSNRSSVGEATGALVGGAVAGPVGAAVGSQMSTLGGRFAKSSQDGLVVFNQVIDSLPQMSQCLTGGAQSSGQLVAASVKLLTSFAASSQNSTGSEMATAISKLTDVMRELRFAGVLRTLNQADFLASMSCLVEVSSENYCTTRDSKLLFDEMMKQLQSRPRGGEAKRLGAGHVLAGYYILTQNIPMITNWIQRVQIGVNPRLPTDANFQNKVFDEVNNFFKKVKDIQGSFAMDVEAMKVIPDEKGRKNAARQIISKLSGIVGDSAFSMDRADSLRNFFTLKGSSREIPFYLMGIDIPNEVLGIGTAMQPPSEWLENNYMKHPAFANPEQLVGVVEKQLNEMIKTAETNAIEYYNKWFIVDKLSLVNESFLGTNYSVKESLQLVNEYLVQVEKRLKAEGGETSMIGSLQDTRTKIRNVMNAYAELEQVSRQLKASGDTLSKEERELIEEANVKIITSVYNEFQILLGKSGWFANRIVKFVYADYLTILKKDPGFGDSVNDLFYATGLSIFDQIVMTAGGNPAKVQNDLSLALRLNKMNLEGVEALMRDHFAATTADLKGVSKLANDKNSLNKAVNTKVSTWDRAYKDGMTKVPGEKINGFNRFMRGLFSATWETLANLPSYVPFNENGSFANEKYTARNERFAVDDEFGSARRLYEQFCIQSLAFADVRSFYHLCRNSVLKSPFADTFLSNLTEQQRAELSTSYDQKLVESRDKPQLNSSKRICAFRDYNRKNLVMYLTNSQTK